MGGDTLNKISFMKKIIAALFNKILSYTRKKNCLARKIKLIKSYNIV